MKRLLTFGDLPPYYPELNIITLLNYNSAQQGVAGGKAGLDPATHPYPLYISLTEEEKAEVIAMAVVARRMGGVGGMA